MTDLEHRIEDRYIPQDNGLKIAYIDMNLATISYPQHAFAFNPIPLTVTRADWNDDIYIAIESNQLTFKRLLAKGKDIEYINLQALAKGLFDYRKFHKLEDKDTELYKELKVNVYLDKDKPSTDGKPYIFTIPIIWGALQIGETFTRKRKLAYFKGYPFTVSVLNSIIADIDIKTGSNKFTAIENAPQGKINIDIPKLFERHQELKNVKQIEVQSYNVEYYGIFDETFDETFQPQRVRLKTDVQLDIAIKKCDPDGVYLRWINKYGEYCYYLLQQSVSKIEIEDTDISLRGSYHTVDFTDNYHFGTGGVTGKSVQEQINLTVPLADKDTFSLLLSLAGSPMVDMFAGYEETTGQAQWIRVHIVDGSFARTTAELQDFDLFLLPAQTLVQSI